MPIVFRRGVRRVVKFLEGDHTGGGVNISTNTFACFNKPSKHFILFYCHVDMHIVLFLSFTAARESDRLMHFSIFI